MTTRCGIGYDIHRLAQNRALVLGGVTIPHGVGLDGHSDADVLCHAVADALLGTIGAGDIGQHFPNDDLTIRGISSIQILERVIEVVRRAGGAPLNIDATIIAEAPKMAPHIPEMRKRIAGATGLNEGSVSVKATTNEMLGPIGRGEGIAAMAVALVQLQ